MKNDSCPLPKTLPGAVCQQFVRCGRRNCRCAMGRLHGPYFYRFWREGGRLRKSYILRTDVERVRSQCQARRQFQTELVAAWKDYREMLNLVRTTEGR
jgi:hypothetical protein